MSILESHASMRDDFEISTPDIDRLVDIAAGRRRCVRRAIDRRRIRRRSGDYLRQRIRRESSQSEQPPYTAKPQHAMVARSCPVRRTAGTKLEQVRRQGDNLKDIAAKRNSGDLICLSHLRWNFVFQRPQHLMTTVRAHAPRIFFRRTAIRSSHAELRITRDRGVFVCVPHIPTRIELVCSHTTNFGGLSTSCRRHRSNVQFSGTTRRWRWRLRAIFPPSAIVFDCMDELSAFHGAPPELLEREQELLNRADLVFTGGQSLYEAKRDRHRRVFAFPSSVDVPHFAAARSTTAEPRRSGDIPHPRLGFFGVVDERMDLELIDAVAAARPDWHLVILGPCVKIDPATLPHARTSTISGMKTYAELPAYLSGWDVALLPFARNESTQFISPTKTPEYLAAGCPVVSTAVRDVVRPYGERGFVSIADSADGFIAAIERALAGQSRGMARRGRSFPRADVLGPHVGRDVRD